MTMPGCYASSYTVLRSAVAGLAVICATQNAALGAEISGFAPVVIEKVSVSRQFKLLRAICEPGQVTSRDGVPACGTSPSYTGGASTGLRISNVIEGAFTRPGAAELLVDLDGCEPAAAGGGGSVLLEARERGWIRTLYQPGLRSNECIRFRTLRQTIALACNSASVKAGIQRGELSWFSLREGKPERQRLLRWYDNSQSNPRRLISVFPHRFMKSDFNSDGRVDLRVSVRLRDEKVPDQYSGFIDAMTAGHRFEDPKSERLVYLFDGNSLTLSPASEAAHAEIQRMLDRVPGRQRH